MSKTLSTRDLDNSFRMLFVLLTLIDGFLFAYGGGQQSDLILTFYFGLNFVPIVILGLIWWTAIFFDKIIWKLFAWFMLFNLVIQSFLLMSATFLSTGLEFFVFPLTPFIVIPIEIAIYRRYINMGKSITKKQIDRTFWLCTIYSLVQLVWYIIIAVWLATMLLLQLFERLLEMLKEMSEILNKP